MASGQHSQFKTREEWRQAQATLEAQKAGTAPPDTDECGNAINPHIPQYMSQAPWYLGYDFKTLKHQRKPDDMKPQVDSIGSWYARGQFQGPAATKYRPGACPNCGSMTHKEKDCVERPRKVANKAKWSGKDIRPDEVLTELALGWDGKRDRWNGVDLDQCQQEVSDKHLAVEQARKDIKTNRVREHLMKKVGISAEQVEDAERRLVVLRVGRDNVVDGKERVEERVRTLRERPRPTEELRERARKQADELDAALKTLLALVPAAEGGLADDEQLAELLAEEDKEKDNVNADAGERDALLNQMDTGGVRDNVDAKVSVRNLRIREDTAKYLRNLSTEARFHYDPKTRSQRGTPYPGKDPTEVDFAGDNWIRSTGDATAIPQMQVFCWDATKRLQDAGHAGKYINLQANPTQAARAFAQASEMREELKQKKENVLLQRYGGAEHLRDRPDEVRQGASETFTVYRRDGTVMQGEEKAVVRSKYEEDIHINGHTSVWGSHWEAGQWGYKCCGCLVHNSLCTAAAAAAAQQEQPAISAPEAAMLLQIQQMEEEMRGAAGRTDQQREKDAERQSRKRGREAEGAGAAGGPAQPELSAGSYDNGNAVQASAMEEWRKRRVLAEDPMAALMRSEEGEEGGPG